MIKPAIKLALLTALALPVLSMPAQAEDGLGAFDKERFQFRLRGIGVLPDDGGSSSIGGEPDVDDAFVPEFDITYFFTKNIAAELILATAKHDVDLKGSASGDLELGSLWILPPTLTLQYHFTPEKAFSPYLGAGVNYTVAYNEDSKDVADLDVDNAWGVALQGGFDYWLNDNWGLNADVKKIWLEHDATVANGTVSADVELDPWIVGVGVSYRF